MADLGWAAFEDKLEGDITAIRPGTAVVRCHRASDDDPTLYGCTAYGKGGETATVLVRVHGGDYEILRVGGG